jgi:hypothetical protein
MKRRYLIMAFILTLVLSVTLVAAEGSNLPGSGWESGQQIQNVSTTDTTTITLTAYDQSGTATDCGARTNVPPGGSVNYLMSDCPVPSGFQGSGVVSAGAPIAAIVNVNNRTVGAAAGQYRGTDGSDVSTTIAFPLVKNSYAGRTTTFYVQNASGQANNITATFSAGPYGGTPSTYTKDYNNVPAYAMVIITVADAGVPANTVGSLRVTGTQPIAGSSLEHQANTGGAAAANLQASKAFTPSEYDQEVFCPLVRSNHTNRLQTTGIQAQNTSGGSQTITLEATVSVNGGPLQTITRTSPTLADGQSHTFFGPDFLPSGALGSATVSGSSGPIAVVVNDRGFALDPSPVTTYACFPASGASNRVVVPLYKEYFFGNTSGIQVQNVSATPVTVQLTYTPVGGSPVTVSHSSPIPAGASKTFFGVSQGTSPTDITGANPSLVNTYGGVVITATGGNIVAIANESSFGGFGTVASGQDTKNYEGFNQ